MFTKMEINTLSKEECMAAKKTIVYECDVCGTEVTVNSEGISNLSPIYCCGVSLSKRKTKLSKKTAVKVKVKKKTTPTATAKKTDRKKPAQTANKAVQKKLTKK